LELKAVPAHLRWNKPIVSDIELRSASICL